MFDLSKINFINDENRRSNYSFVGLKKENDSINFHLPIGFNDFKKDSFEDTKDLFLNLYKIFKKFQKNHIKNRDGNINQKGGFEFINEENETILLYSKINMFDSILDEFDDMDIYAFQIKRSKSDKIDYSKIDKYIDQAIFLENHTIYLDEVEINKDTLAFDESELVEMFCYIYCDIKKALVDDRDIAVEIQSLALNFREKHLTYDSSLFEEHSFEITKNILKDRLEVIDKYALLKDATYDKFYEAIYIFLYGNPFFEGDEDIYWGIDNFAFVWEEMCHYYFFEKHKDSIFFADTSSFENGEVGGNKCYKKDDFQYPFVLNYAEEDKYLYPDLVCKDNYIINNLELNITEELSKSSYGGYYKIEISHKLIKILGEELKNKYDFKKRIYSFYNEENGYENIFISYIKNDMSYDYTTETKRNKDYRLLSTQLEEDYIQKVIQDKIIDFKYMIIDSLKEINNNKVQKDIKKQLLYKLALQSTDEKLIIDNIFYIPSSLNKTNHVEIESLHNSDIEVRYLNFNDATKSYLEYKDDE